MKDGGGTGGFHGFPEGETGPPPMPAKLFATTAFFSLILKNSGLEFND
jgi:hypothetical protein